MPPNDSNPWVPFLIGLGLTLAALLLLRWVLRIRGLLVGLRRGAIICGHCRYDLAPMLKRDGRGDLMTTGRCSECGRDLSLPRGVRVGRFVHWKRLIAWSVWLVMLASGAVLMTHSIRTTWPIQWVKRLPNSMVIGAYKLGIFEDTCGRVVFERSRKPDTPSIEELRSLAPIALARLKVQLASSPTPGTAQPVSPFSGSGGIVTAVEWRDLLTDAQRVELIEAIYPTPPRLNPRGQIELAPANRSLLSSVMPLTWRPLTTKIGCEPVLTRWGYGGLVQIAFVETLLPRSLRATGGVCEMEWRLRAPRRGSDHTRHVLVRSVTLNLPPPANADITPPTFTVAGCESNEPPSRVTVLMADGPAKRGDPFPARVVEWGAQRPPDQMEQVQAMIDKKPVCIAQMGARVKLIAEDGAEHLLGFLVVVDEARSRNTPLGIFTSHEVVPPDVRDWLKTQTTARVVIQSDEAIEQEYLPSGKVWRGRFEQIVPVKNLYGQAGSF